MSATTEDDDEIDWDQIQNSLDNNLEVDILSVKKARTQPPCVGVQGTRGTKCTSRKKAEAAKKKSNKLTGTLPSLIVLNSIDNNHLIKLAKASNINLGDTAERIASSLSTLQANERAKATILAAKKKMAEQADNKELECDHANINKEGVAADGDQGIETETEGGAVFPPVKETSEAKTAREKRKSEEGDRYQKKYK
jgi:hypothetical protein